MSSDPQAHQIVIGGNSAIFYVYAFQFYFSQSDLF